MANYNANIPHGPAAEGDMDSAMRDVINQFARMAPALTAAIIPGATDVQKTRAGQTLTGVSEALLTHQNAGAAKEVRVGPEEKVPICTTLPVYGQIDILPVMRDYKIFDFSGKKGDKIGCLDFLTRVADQSGSSTLTEAASILLLQKHCIGDANDLIRVCIRERMSFEEIVRTFEKRFAGLLHPEKARSMCSSVTRNPQETLLELSGRIRKLAWMACRLLPTALDDEIKLSEQVFQHCLTPLVRSELDQVHRLRKVAGSAAWTYTEYADQANQIEEKYKILKTSGAMSKVAWVGETEEVTELFTEEQAEDAKTIGLIARVLSLTATSRAKDGLTSVQTQPPTLKTEDNKASNIQYGGNGYQPNQSGGYQPNQPNRYRPNSPYPRENRSRYGQSRSPRRPDSRSGGRGGRSARSESRDRRPSGDRRDGSQRRGQRDGSQRREQRDRTASPYGRDPYRARSSSRDNRYNNPQGTGCFKCGREGHMMRDQSCPIYKATLTSDPCARCKSGKHTPTDCPNRRQEESKN